MLFAFVLPSYISSDNDPAKNSRAAVRARGGAKRPTNLLGELLLLQFRTSRSYEARRQDGDFAKIDLAVTKKPLSTLAVAVVDLAALPPRRRPLKGLS